MLDLDTWGYGTVKHVCMDPEHDRDFWYVVRLVGEDVHREYGNVGDSGNGLFMVSRSNLFPTSSSFRVIASNGGGWDHVSVSLPDRCPTWEEMCVIKWMFFGGKQEVIQYHPSEDQYVNCHPYCLHLWRPQNEKIPMPPSAMVGPRDGQSDESLRREVEAM